MKTETTLKKEKRRSWNWRSLVSFHLLFAAIALLISGVALFVAPPGRFAHSTGWRLLGFDKGQWEAIHTMSGYAGTLFAMFHLVLNWKALRNYLRDRARHAYRLKPEFVVALLLTVVVWIGSAYHIPPFGTVMDWGENIKESWEQQTVLPITTTEEHETVELAEEETIPPDTTTEEHETVEPTEEEAVSPTTIEEHEDGGPTGKWGQFTVEELCTRQGIPVADGLAHLAAYGLEAGPTTRVRTLSDSSIYAPSDVANIILGLETGEHETPTATETPPATATPGTVACPFGRVNDPYPGQCKRYVDTNDNGICDLSEPGFGDAP